MTEFWLYRLEQWAWRLVMPALLWGGALAGFFLLLAAIFRVWRWRRYLRDCPWSVPGRIWPWLLYYGLQVLTGLWSANTDAWIFGLEAKASRR